MQHLTNKHKNITKAVAKIVKRLREKTGLSATKFADSFGIVKSKVLRIEDGSVQCKLVSIWEVANALGMKCSELVAIIEQELGDDFTLIDE